MDVISLNNVRELQSNLGHSLVIKSRVPGSNTVPKYKLLQELYIQLSNGDIIHIPEGFVWDLASVPRPLWGLLPPDSDAELASLVHDFLYIHKNDFNYSRRFVDDEMLKWSKVLSGTKNKISARNVDNIVRYVGVRLGGWAYWNRR